MDRKQVAYYGIAVPTIFLWVLIQSPVILWKAFSAYLDEWKATISRAGL